MACLLAAAACLVSLAIAARAQDRPRDLLATYLRTGQYADASRLMDGAGNHGILGLPLAIALDALRWTVGDREAVLPEAHVFERPVGDDRFHVSLAWMCCDKRRKSRSTFARSD